MKIKNPSRSPWLFSILATIASVVLLGDLLAPAGLTQSLTGLRKIDISTGKEMIKLLRKEVEKNYYDAQFHGVDIEAQFKAAESKVDQAQSLGQVYGIVGQPLLNLNDMHSFFIPPPRNARTDYGWQMQMIGDQAFVTVVRPLSDALSKGLKEGDQILSIDGYKLTRGNFWKLTYIYYIIRPGATPRLIVQTPDGQQKQIDVVPKVTQNQQILNFETSSNGRIDTRNLINWVVDEGRERKNRMQDISDDTIVWQMPHLDVDETTINGLVSQVRRKKALILDLRNHVGGREEILESFAGSFFDQDKKIADFKGRKEYKSLTAKTRGDGGFKGKLVIIVDATTAGTGELFARLVQIEKRGTIIGDVTMGSTMKAKLNRYDLGTNPFAASISEAESIPPDGKGLERVGITPDELLLPTPQDLAAHRDPILVRAAALCGITLDPAKAGTLFPIVWHRELLKE